MKFIAIIHLYILLTCSTYSRSTTRSQCWCVSAYIRFRCPGAGSGRLQRQPWVKCKKMQNAAQHQAERRRMESRFLRCAAGIPCSPWKDHSGAGASVHENPLLDKGKKMREGRSVTDKDLK